MTEGPFKDLLRTQTKKPDGPYKNSLQPPSLQAVYDVERPVSPSIHSANSEAAADNAPGPPTTQHNTSTDNRGRPPNKDARVKSQDTYSNLDTRCQEAVCYTNEEYLQKYQKMKYATDPDGYLKANDFEQTSASTTRTEKSVVTSLYANADGMSPPTSQTYTNEGGKATAKKEGNLTARLGRRLQKARAADPISPSVFVSAFRKHSAGRSLSSDRRTSKVSNHIYAEIVDDDVFVSTIQPADVQPITKEGNKKERSKLKKKLSAKKWSENEGAVGY